MAESNDGLTLEGLAQILRDHMDGSAARFAEERAERKAQDARWRASIQDLRGEIGTVASLVRDVSQIVLRQVDQLAEYRRESEEQRQQVRQIFSRMEQQDGKIAEQNARIEVMTLEIREMRHDIRRILDAMERRGGDGGHREA
jgi:methyl-accepting chemotaxis protein